MTTASSLAFTIDSAHTNASFAVRHLMISKVRGHFARVTGHIEMPATGTIPVSVLAEIDAASVDTRDPQRDGHLRSADFLDVEKYPAIRFTSTRVDATDAEHFTVTGDLELHGVTRSVTLDATASGRGKDPWGLDRAGFEATTRIKRGDFGLTWNQALELGGVAVGDDIEITIDVEATAPQG